LRRKPVEVSARPPRHATWAAIACAEALAVVELFLFFIAALAT
jgi:hypothetical protein